MTVHGVSLGEVAAIERRAVSPGEIGSHEIYVGLENITSGGEFESVATAGEAGLKSNKFAFTEDHVLYGKLRPYLAKIAVPDFRGVCSTDILPIRPGGRLDRRYLLHFLRTPEMVAHAANNSVGINLPRLSPKALEAIVIPLPSIEEQRRIAAVLDTAEALRAKRRQALAKLDDLIQAVFTETFGNPARIRKWPMVPLASVCHGKGEYGANVPAAKLDGERPRYLRITDIRDDGSLIEAAVAPGGSQRDWQSKFLRAGDVVFARSGSIGKSFLVRDEHEPLVFAGYLIRFSPDQTKVHPEYLYRYAQTQSFWAWVSSVATTVAQPNINARKYAALNLPLPPLDVQHRFVGVIDRIRQGRKTLEKHTARLDDLFASLQQRAFRGEL